MTGDCLIFKAKSFHRYGPIIFSDFFSDFGWLRGSVPVVERWSLTGELSLSCARPAADR